MKVSWAKPCNCTSSRSPACLSSRWLSLLARTGFHSSFCLMWLSWTRCCVGLSISVTRLTESSATWFGFWMNWCWPSSRLFSSGMFQTLCSSCYWCAPHVLRVSNTDFHRFLLNRVCVCQHNNAKSLKALQRVNSNKTDICESISCMFGAQILICVFIKFVLVLMDVLLVSTGWHVV